MPSLLSPADRAPCNNQAVPDVVVFGASGQLGTGLIPVLRAAGLDVAAAARSVDLQDARALAAAVAQAKPRWVVNAAAMTDVDGAHADPARAFAINALGAGEIARAANAIGARTVHVSTEAVFDGEQQVPYTEADPCRPVSVYGASKRAGESLVSIYDPQAYVLRTSWLYGQQQGANFPTRLLANLARGSSEVPVVTDVVGNPTPVAVLADAIRAVIESPCDPGLYHVCCTGAASKFDWAIAIAEHAGLDPRRIIPVTADAFPTPAARPKHVDLSVRQFAATGLLELPSWRAAWERYAF